MAAPVRESHSETINTSPSSDECIIDKPTGTAEGDLLLAWVCVDQASGSINLPSGWTAVAAAIANDNMTRMAWKEAGASEPSTYTFDGWTNHRNVGYMIRISGADTTSPIDTYATDDTSSADPHVISAITPTVDECYCVAFSEKDFRSISSASGTNWSGLIDDFNITTIGGGWADQTQSTAASTNNVSFDYTTTRPSTGWIVAIAPESAQEISPGGIDASPSFGTAKLNLNLAPGGIASTLAFGLPSVEFPSQTLEPGGIASTLALGSHEIATGAVVLNPGGIASTTALGSHTITTGVVCVSPTGIAGGTVLGSPTIIPGAVTLQPSGIDASAGYGSHTITTGAVNVEPGGIDASPSYGTHEVAAGENLQPSGIAPTTALGLPALTTGAVNIEPTGIDASPSYGTHELQPGAVSLSPTGIAPTTGLGSHTVSPGAATVSPGGIDASPSYGTHELVHVIDVTGIAPTVGFGAHAVEPQAVTIQPTGIASTVTLGTHAVTGGAAAAAAVGSPLPNAMSEG